MRYFSRAVAIFVNFFSEPWPASRNFCDRVRLVFLGQNLNPTTTVFQAASPSLHLRRFVRVSFRAIVPAATAPSHAAYDDGSAQSVGHHELMTRPSS